MTEQLRPSIQEISPKQIRGDMESVVRRFIRKDCLGKGIEFRSFSAEANSDGFVVSQEKYQDQAKTVVDGLICVLPNTALRLKVRNIYGEDEPFDSIIETNIVGEAIPENDSLVYRGRFGAVIRKKDLRKATERVFQLPKKGLTWSSHSAQPCPIGELASIDAKGKLPSGESVYFSLDVMGRVYMVVKRD